MSQANLKPPDCEHTELPAVVVTSDEADQIRQQFSRSPRPYRHERRVVLLDHDGECATNSGGERPHKGHLSIPGSESGTEADDERPTSFVKALPAPNLRPRKGLKDGEANEDALLTPSQLDDEGRRLGQGYFRPSTRDKATSSDEAQAEQEKLQRRRFAEFLRRTSEVGLMGVLVVAVLCGQETWRVAWAWRWELLSHAITITALVLAYPVKLSVVDTQKRHTKLWQRFRVPASFDPATVLYPPLLPVLAALSVAESQPAAILPNIILGLSSLPQRLFPRSTRLSGVNAVHWFVSLIPLIVSENTNWLSQHSSPTPSMPKTDSPIALPSETLALLYLLHHALLQPLHYLATSSLLVSELHLLSVALINLLFLSQSPQAVILKSCLWIGGLSIFVCCGPILNWNVTLARVPKWRLRKPTGAMSSRRKSMVDTVSDWVTLQRGNSAFKSPSDTSMSDGDDGQSFGSAKPQDSSWLPHIETTGLSFHLFDAGGLPRTATGPHHLTWSPPEPMAPKPRPRRNTLPERFTDLPKPPQAANNRQRKRSKVQWYLDVTPDQANRRRWLYAGLVYVIILATIFVPVRDHIGRKALHHYEPIGWALSYLFGQIPALRSSVDVMSLQDWVPLPTRAGCWPDWASTPQLGLDHIRDSLGAANVRLLLLGYWAAVLVMGLLAVFSLTAFVEVDTRRKVFHGVMVAMLLPATFIDPCYCALALALALAIFLLLEVVRAGQIRPLSTVIGRFVAPYVDGRDLRGPVVVSHIFLLIGCAVPLWFSLASVGRAGGVPWLGWEVLPPHRRDVAMVSGVVCVGMGDAAASLIGRRFGRRKWIWIGGKSLEGSAAFAVAVVLGLLVAKAWLAAGGWSDHGTRVTFSPGSLGFALGWVLVLAKATFCACVASFMEAVLTGANDNVVVPVALWLAVKGVRL